MTSRRVMMATGSKVPWQLGHTRGSTSKLRFINSCQGTYDVERRERGLLFGSVLFAASTPTSDASGEGTGSGVGFGLRAVFEGAGLGLGAWAHVAGRSRKATMRERSGEPGASTPLYLHNANRGGATSDANRAMNCIGRMILNVAPPRIGTLVSYAMDPSRSSRRREETMAGRRQ